MAMIGLHFNDFKSLSNNHRIYYYVGEDYYDFLYLVDGIIVKTTVAKHEIDNMERFFSDKMFYGAMQLTFPIENPSSDLFSKIMGVKHPLDSPLNVQDVQEEEVKNDDIQVEGVAE
jgi:hypothetical protein